MENVFNMCSIVAPQKTLCDFLLLLYHLFMFGINYELVVDVGKSSFGRKCSLFVFISAFSYTREENELGYDGQRIETV